MKKKKIYRTVIQVEVLSEYPIEESLSLSDIQRECDEGDFSGKWKTIVDNQPISGKVAANFTIAQGSNPEFFQMDEDGNELD